MWICTYFEFLMLSNKALFALESSQNVCAKMIKVFIFFLF
ncbi:hypothetical protein HMPREF9399_0871 [Campylobacter coli JV20]|nr:hypothetical protein HMPREF9399_0871 [Campylobacter coli JV20]